MEMLKIMCFNLFTNKICGIKIKAVSKNSDLSLSKNSYINKKKLGFNQIFIAR